MAGSKLCNGCLSIILDCDRHNLFKDLGSAKESCIFHYQLHASTLFEFHQKNVKKVTRSM